MPRRFGAISGGVFGGVANVSSSSPLRTMVGAGLIGAGAAGVFGPLAPGIAGGIAEAWIGNKPGWDPGFD